MKLTLTFVALALFVGAATASPLIPDISGATNGIPAIPAIPGVNGATNGIPAIPAIPVVGSITGRSAVVQARASLTNGQDLLKDLDSQLNAIGTISKRADASVVQQAQDAIREAVAELTVVKRAAGTPDFESAIKNAAEQAQKAIEEAQSAIEDAGSQINDAGKNATSQMGDLAPNKMVTQAGETLSQIEEALQQAFGGGLPSVNSKRDGLLLGNTNVLGSQSDNRSGPSVGVSPFKGLGKRDGLLLNNVGVLADQKNHANDDPTEMTGASIPAIADLVGRDGLLVNNVAVMGEQTNDKPGSAKQAGLVKVPAKLLARDGVVGNNVNLGGKQANSRKGSAAKGTLIQSPDLAGLLPRAGVLFNNLNLLGEQTRQRESSPSDQKLIGRQLTGAVEVANVELVGTEDSLLGQI